MNKTIMRNKARMVMYVSLALITDGGALSKSSKISLWPIAAQILDLPPVLQKSVSNLVLLAIHVGDCNPDWQQIFGYINPQIRSLGRDDGALEFNQLRYKVRILEVLADNKAKAQILFMKEAPCYYGCPHCVMKGAPSGGTTIYPHEQRPSPMRTDWIAMPNASNGIKAITPLSEIVQLPLNVQIDMMHTTYSGTIDYALHEMYNRNSLFFKNLCSPRLLFNKPLEIKREFCEKRCFADINRLKTNELRVIAHYIFPVILPHLADVGLDYNSQRYKQAVNVLLLCSALSVLASKNLTAEKIKFANSLLINWHKTIASAFDVQAQTYKAHLHLHYAEACKKFGSSTSHTCFFLESCVGYIGKKVTCPTAALKQIEERLRSLPCEGFEEILQYFSTKKFSTLMNSYQFSAKGLPEKFQEYLRSKFHHATIRCAKEVKFEHFTLKSRMLRPHQRYNDSVVFISSTLDGSPIPVMAELFFKANNSEKVWLLARAIKIVKPLAKSFAWIEGQIQARLLLTNAKSFPGCFLVNSELGEIGLVSFNEQRILNKGLMVKFNNGDIQERVVFPMGVFDHD